MDKKPNEIHKKLIQEYARESTQHTVHVVEWITLIKYTNMH